MFNFINKYYIIYIPNGNPCRDRLENKVIYFLFKSKANSFIKEFINFQNTGKEKKYVFEEFEIVRSKE